MQSKSETYVFVIDPPTADNFKCAIAALKVGPNGSHECIQLLSEDTKTFTDFLSLVDTQFNIFYTYARNKSPNCHILIFTNSFGTYGFHLVKEEILKRNFKKLDFECVDFIIS